MNNEAYNGWSNYETWLANLWIDNEQGSQEYWREIAEDAIREAIDSDESEPRRRAASATADQLREHFEGQAGEVVPESGMFADFLNAALGRVDWREIAQHWVNDVEIFAAGWNMPGYLPDNPPSMFLSFDDAADYLADSLRDEFDQSDDDDADCGISEDDIARVRAAKGPEFGETFGKYHYFVSKV